MKFQRAGKTIFQLSRKEDKDIIYDKYSVESQSEKKENELEEGEINSETEMDKTSERNQVGKVEIDEKGKEKRKRRSK